MTSQSPRLRAMFCDHLSIMRGKYLPASKMKDDESRFARPTFSVHYDKDLLIEAPGTMCLEGIPDMALRWKVDEIWTGGSYGPEGGLPCMVLLSALLLVLIRLYYHREEGLEAK